MFIYDSSTIFCIVFKQKIVFTEFAIMVESRVPGVYSSDFQIKVDTGNFDCRPIDLKVLIIRKST